MVWGPDVKAHFQLYMHWDHQHPTDTPSLAQHFDHDPQWMSYWDAMAAKGTDPCYKGGERHYTKDCAQFH